MEWQLISAELRLLLLRCYDVDIATLSEARHLVPEGRRPGSYIFLKGIPTGAPNHYCVGLAVKNSLLPSLTETSLRHK